MNKEAILQSIKGGLIVSCQALPGEPLYNTGVMPKMALAAKLGGAVGIRANGFDDIKAIKNEVGLPVIGIVKKDYDDSDVYITPTIEEVKTVVAAGADIVAADATNRVRPNGKSLKEFYEEVRNSFPDVLLMADVSTFEEALEAAYLGFDLVGTTLCGYTEYTKGISIPDFELIRKMVRSLNIPVIAEGGIWMPEQLKKALDLGVHAAVVGSAITRPMEITKRFVSAIKKD